MKLIRHATCCLIAMLLLPCQRSQGDPAPETNQQNSQAESQQQENYQRFEQLLSGVKLVGRFTVLGKDDGPLPKEEYTITRVKKMPNGDYWLVNARIQYGQTDVALPLPLEVKWAGDTPMITLTDLTIPGLGTFSSRVVFYNKKYAGTWTHGKVGGHLFGVIEKLEADAEPSDTKR